MRADEDRVRMSRDDAVALLEDFLFRWEPVAVERPVGPETQRVDSLIVAVHGREEGLGVGDVDHHRDSEFAALGPYRIDPGIVHRHDLAVLVANRQAQRLGDLQAADAQPHGLFQSTRLALPELRLVDPAEVRAKKHQEAILGDTVRNP